jgi:hypothetical protein
MRKDEKEIRCNIFFCGFFFCALESISVAAQIGNFNDCNLGHWTALCCRVWSGGLGWGIWRWGLRERPYTEASEMWLSTLTVGIPWQKISQENVRF